MYKSMAQGMVLVSLRYVTRNTILLIHIII